MTPVELSFSVAPASSRAGSSASVCRPEPYPRSGQEWRATSSLRQRLVREALANGSAHKAIEPIQRVPLAVTIVQPERELVDIPAKVLAAGVVVDAENTAPPVAVAPVPAAPTASTMVTPLPAKVNANRIIDAYMETISVGPNHEKLIRKHLAAFLEFSGGKHP